MCHPERKPLSLPKGPKSKGPTVLLRCRGAPFDSGDREAVAFAQDDMAVAFAQDDMAVAFAQDDMAVAFAQDDMVVAFAQDDKSGVTASRGRGRAAECDAA